MRKFGESGQGLISTGKQIKGNCLTFSKDLSSQPSEEAHHVENSDFADHIPAERKNTWFHTLCIPKNWNQSKAVPNHALILTSLTLVVQVYLKN